MGQTVGAEFCVKQVPIPETNVVVELSIFDCAGQSMFNQLEMNARYYEGASAVMVVYDIGSNDSLKSTPKWLEAVRNAQRSTNQRAPISVLVGNKRDFRMGAGAPGSDARAEVVLQDAQRHAASMGVQLFEVSAVRVCPGGRFLLAGMCGILRPLHPLRFLFMSFPPPPPFPCLPLPAQPQMTNEGVDEPFKFVAEELYKWSEGKEAEDD